MPGENLPRRVWNRQTKFTYNHWLAALVKGKCSSTKPTRLATGVMCHPDTEQNRPYKIRPWPCRGLNRVPTALLLHCKRELYQCATILHIYYIYCNIVVLVVVVEWYQLFLAQGLLVPPQILLACNLILCPASSPLLPPPSDSTHNSSI